MAVEKEADVENNVLVFLHQTKVSTQIIYSITLFAIIAALCSLPFIHTTVSVKGSGSLQSNIEKNELLAPISGRVTRINLTDNQKRRYPSKYRPNASTKARNDFKHSYK